MDMEAQGHSDHSDALRLWLRMLTCSQLIEKRVRNNLREQFDTTLPRFDLMMGKRSWRAQRAHYPHR